METDGGTLGYSFEHHVTVSNFTAPVGERERVDPAHVAAVTKDIAVFGDLQQERSSYFALTVFPVCVLNEEDAPFVIELNFAIDKIRSYHLNRLAACFLRNHVDCFLRKRVPQQRPLAPAATHDNVESLAPAAPILLLFVRPFANQHH